MTDRAERAVWRVFGAIAIAIVGLSATAWAGWVSTNALTVPVIDQRVTAVQASIDKLESKIDALLLDRGIDPGRMEPRR